MVVGPRELEEKSESMKRTVARTGLTCLYKEFPSSCKLSLLLPLNLTTALFYASRDLGF